MIPRPSKVSCLQAHQLYQLLKNIVQSEEHEHELKSQDEKIILSEKGNQFNSIDHCSRKDASCCRKLKEECDYTEEVDVCIVCGEV